MLRNLRNLEQSDRLQVSLPGMAHPYPTNIPRQFGFLVANVLTQYACIRGVNYLAASSSALTVTIVLNVRKLVSLLLSIWLFDNNLARGTIIGALLVFGAGGLYSLGTNPPKRTKRASPEGKKTI